MKIRLLLLYVLLSLCCVVQVQARGGCAAAGGGVSAAAVADHCASGCTPDDADFACLDFETGAVECSFAETVGAGASISYVSHTNTFSCTDKGSKAMQVVAKDTTATYIKRDMGSTKSTFALQFYFQVTSETLANTEVYRLFVAEQINESTSAMRISFIDTSGTLYLGFYLNQTADIVVNSTNAIALNTWYRIRLFFVDETTLKVHLAQHNGTAIETIYDSDVSGAPSGSNVPRYLYFGGHNVNAVGDVTLQYDNIKIDTSAEITTGCTQ